MQGERGALHPGTGKLSYTKFPSLHYPTLSYFTKFSLELEALRKFWFPVVGGASGKGRTPMAALSEGTTCTNLFPPFLYPCYTDSGRAFSLALPPLSHPIIPVDLLSPCPGEAR